MTKAEEQTLRNLITRLQQPRCGCTEPFPDAVCRAEVQAPGYEGVSRLYLDTWVIPALSLLLPGPDRDPELAAILSGR